MLITLNVLAGMIEWAWSCGAKPLPATICRRQCVSTHIMV